MGLIFTDSFDSYSVTNDISAKWNALTNWTYGATAGRNGGGGALCSSSSQPLRTPNIFGGVSAGYFCVAWYAKYANGTPPGNFTLVQLIDSIGQVAGALDTGGAGNKCLILIGSAGGIILAGNTVVMDGNFHHFEWRFNLANASNLGSLWIDGVQEWNVAVNMNSNARAATALQFETAPNCNALGFGPVYVYDSNGAPSAQTDYPLGQCSLGTKRPSSDAVVQFTPNSGVTNFSRVNEQTPDGDTSYVETGVSGNQDLYGYTPLPNITVTPAKIWGAMLNSDVENPVAGTLSSQGICKSGATQQNGAVQVCPTSYSIQQQPFNLDPNGNVTWTLAALDAANFGFKAV